MLAILSIFATLGYFWIPSSKLHLAQNQIISDLNYTRFLSLNSAKHITQSAFCQSDNCAQERTRWSESLWRIQFSLLQDIGYAYYIFSDSARSVRTKNFDDRPRDRQEIARDLLDNKYLNVYNSDNSKFANPLRNGDLAITQRYGIQNVKISGGCGEGYKARILFDAKGFLLCKKPYEKPTIPNGNVFLGLFNKSGESVKICILPSGFIQKC
ncbi:prepilin-type cleavage/methylation domain-containing protein [Helicobacter sp.]|uniref:prepilin-type cleavage/methylation domain-containing protein n=1 Tax=Helicobacter sp. TaxID=218 RepID=UPI0025C313AB|nr:prepilin-type cleavage/methylation domain-containing protein [Helicobacter sp.]MCI5968260.1 prepilin-type cleavage/methylation domain-containing protein [Helicobacter sp.]MDY2584890.1 prepilin-type cleavage/methylation domain-containing protein [Helicobacter sp.]